MNKFVSIDLETLAKTEDAAIIEIGAVIVEGEEIIGRFEANPSVESNLMSGRVKDESTLQWWVEQETKGNPCPLHGMEPLSNALMRLSDFLPSGVPIWARGPQFDINKLEHAMRHYALAFPWKYDVIRDLRTFELEVLDEEQQGIIREALKPLRDELQAHTALGDAEYQAEHILAIKHYLRTGHIL